MYITWSSVSGLSFLLISRGFGDHLKITKIFMHVSRLGQTIGRINTLSRHGLKDQRYTQLGVSKKTETEKLNRKIEKLYRKTG